MRPEPQVLGCFEVNLRHHCQALMDVTGPVDLTEAASYGRGRTISHVG